MNKLNTCLLAGSSVLLFLASCSDPISDVKFENWEPEVASALLDTRFSLRDAIGNTDFSGYLTEDADSGLRLKVSQKLFEATPADYIPVSQITIPLLDTVSSYDLAAEGIGLTRMDFTGGWVRFTYFNDQAEDVSITTTSTSLVLSGNPLVHNFQVPAFATASDSIPAIGLQLITDGGIVNIDYTAVTTSGNEVKLPIGTLALRETDFTYLEGALDKIELELGNDSIDLAFFETFEPGQLELVDPVATLQIRNEVGAPFGLRTPVSYGQLRDGSRLDFISALSSGFTFAYPSLEEGKVLKTSNLVIDKETSNVLEVLNAFPTSVQLGLAGVVNPDSLSEPFFLHRDAKVEGTFELDMPLAVRFRGFELNKDFVFDASSFDEAEAAAFRITVDNGFGLEAATQVYFYDAGGNVLDSLFDQPEVVLAAAEVDEFGATTASVERMTEVTFDKSRVSKIANTRSAKVTIFLRSPNNGDGITRLYYDNEIGVQLGARLTVKPL